MYQHQSEQLVQLKRIADNLAYLQQIPDLCAVLKSLDTHLTELAEFFSGPIEVSMETPVVVRGEYDTPPVRVTGV